MTQNQRYNSQRRAVLLDPTPAAVDKGGGRLKDANVLLKHSNKNRELNTIVCVCGGGSGGKTTMAMGKLYPCAHYDKMPHLVRSLGEQPNFLISEYFI